MTFRFQKAITLMSLIGMLFMLGACGKKGPLKLPDSSEQQTQ